MAIKLTLSLIEGIVFRMTRKLMIFIPGQGRAGSDLRMAVGDLNAFINQYVQDGTFAQRLLLCFRLAVDAGITLEWMDVVLEQLFSERHPLSDLVAISVVQNSIILALAADARIISVTEFRSRDDVEATMKRMNKWFNQAREFAANEMANPSYLTLVDLHAKVTRYLADTARPLPRMVTFELEPLPALTASNRVYGDGARWDEIVQENHIVHPAFCMPVLRGLSE